MIYIMVLYTFFWRDFDMFQPWSQGKAMHITTGSRYCSWCGGPKTINHPQVRLKWGGTIPSPTANKTWQKDLAFCGLSERLREWSTIFATINFDIVLFMFPSFAWLFLHVPLRKMKASRAVMDSGGSMWKWGFSGCWLLWFDAMDMWAMFKPLLVDDYRGFVLPPFLCRGGFIIHGNLFHGMSGGTWDTRTRSGTSSCRIRIAHCRWGRG